TLTLSLSFCSLIPRPPTSTLFPYTTLFRSSVTSKNAVHGIAANSSAPLNINVMIRDCAVTNNGIRGVLASQVGVTVRVTRSTIRSEEHTSELQSLRHLVCRLLLEKKNKRTN